MVDVSSKAPTARTATATGALPGRVETLEAIDRTMEIGAVRVTGRPGGMSGSWTRA
jgi:molybdenum cofactor biosynthesis enzyme